MAMTPQTWRETDQQIWGFVFLIFFLINTHLAFLGKISRGRLLPPYFFAVVGAQASKTLCLLMSHGPLVVTDATG